MRYWLGIDIGTTATAAAVRRDDGTASVVALGDHGTTVPSAAFLDADGSFVFGERALRRGLDDPERVARHFKRRIGDPVPLVLGRSPVTPQLLHARLLRTVVEQVAAREGGWPVGVVVAHPANWSAYKLDLVRSAAEQASVNVAGFVAEPVAAAVAYAADRPLPAGAHVAVYDLGGGTFDACVLRARGDGGFDLAGPPVGVDQLGGIDLDEAVLAHLRAHVDGALDGADDDPVTRAALVGLRRECTAAKEALSSDPEVTIPVLLPSVSTTVRLTRAELEEAIRPAIDETVLALHRAIDGAGLLPAQLHAVLLVGGSSRIPLVAERVSAAVGRPVVVDAHPKDVVALGAARVAAGEAPGEATGDLSPATATASATATATDPAVAARELDVTPPARHRRPAWVPVVAASAAVAVLAAAFLLLRPDGDDEAAGGDDPTTTTTGSDPTTTTTDSDGDGGSPGPGGLGPEDFAAAGITEFGPEAEAMWVPSCEQDTGEEPSLATLSDQQRRDLCTCIYGDAEAAFDDVTAFVEAWYSDDDVTDPLRGIISGCTFEVIAGA